MKNKKARALLVLTAMIWGATFSVIKGGLNEASPLMLLGCRFGLAFAVFALLAPGSFRRLNGQALKDGLILGLLMFLGYGLQTLGLRETSASRSGFITYTYALLTPFLQLLLLKKRPGRATLIGLAIVLVGFFLISRPGAGRFGRGDWLTLGGAFAMAFYVVFMDISSRRTDNSLLVLMQFFVCALLSFLLAPLTEAPFINWTESFIFAIVFLSLFGSVAAVYFMTRYQKELSPSRAVLIYALEPLFALVFAFLLMGERPGLQELGGCALIVGGVTLSEFFSAENSGGENKKKNANSNI